jgi:predicted ATPase
VQGILAARIDRLAPEEKALLQQLSVIGRQFPMSLVRQVITQLEADFYRLLASLQRKEFLYEQPAFPEPEYIFKHALTQEVAYGTVLQERRKVLHERTGQALEALYAETLPEHYSNLAHHYCRSANTQKAVEYLSLGGQQAAQRSANLEAVMMLTEAVALVQHLPATPEHLQQELRLQTALGPLLLATKGYGAVETESVYTRAYALCHQLGETSQLFPVLWGLQQLYTTRADYQKAREYGEQMLSVAQRLQDPSLLLWAYRGLGEVSSCLGEFPAAKTYCENTVALYDPQQWQAQTFIYGEVPTIGARAFLSTSLFVLGYPDRALQTIRDAVTLAREVAHANSLAFASYMTAWVYVLRRESGEARAQAEAVISMTTEQGLPFWSALGTIVWGWALAVQGDSAAGIAELRQGLTAFQTIGSAQFNPSWLALLAEAYWRDGRVEEGLATVAEALEFVDKTDERFYEAEVWRIKGELTLQKEWKVESQKLKVPNPQPLAANTQAEAEACFLKAVAIAQKQQAKSLELRAVMSLARLWQSQGKTTEACNLLAPVYNWFTEGFDTKDLQEAKALIEELSH